MGVMRFHPEKPTLFMKNLEFTENLQMCLLSVLCFVCYAAGMLLAYNQIWYIYFRFYLIFNIKRPIYMQIIW